MNNVITNQALLSISKLSFAYDASAQTNNVINHLSLSINCGEIVSVLGASGCGKSTLLNLIAGLLAPTEGRIELVDHQASNKRWQQIGYIFQTDALFPWRTVESNLMLAAEVNQEIDKTSIKDHIAKYLQVFHLNPVVLKQYPSQLSGGMRQRISIMQTLMFDPKLILLDEPFAALDFFTKLKLEGEVQQLIKDQKKAALLITHDIDEAIAVSDRVLVMDNGSFTKEFKIDFEESDRTPEDIRGTAKFAEYYHSVWTHLRSVIQE